MESTADNTTQAHYSKNVSWFNPDIEEVSEAFRDLLENYSQIAADAVKPHILNVVRSTSVNHFSTTTKSKSLARKSLGDLSIPLHWPILFPDLHHYQPLLL